MSISRRAMLKTSVGVAVASTLSHRATAAEALPKLRKAVKFGMIQIKGSVLDKFKLIKSIGFQGVELDSPSGLNKEEVVKARDESGIVIHGVVDSVHWNQRLSDPRAEIRAKGLEALNTAIKDCKLYGGDTVLLVPGAVRDKQNENFEQVWERSTEEVKKAIPLAQEQGIKICIETVWNEFITTPEQLVKYVDQFNTPTVGAYFDISNMLKYGVPSEAWIRKLGKRLYKFDFKGYHMDRKWVAIGEGSENWPEVLKALGEIGYDGWATSEVGGGGEEHLRDIARRMDQVLGLKIA